VIVLLFFFPKWRAAGCFWSHFFLLLALTKAVFPSPFRKKKKSGPNPFPFCFSLSPPSATYPSFNFSSPHFHNLAPTGNTGFPAPFFFFSTLFPFFPRELGFFSFSSKGQEGPSASLIFLDPRPEQICNDSFFFFFMPDSPTPLLNYVSEGICRPSPPLPPGAKNSRTSRIGSFPFSSIFFLLPPPRPQQMKPPSPFLGGKRRSTTKGMPCSFIFSFWIPFPS